MTNRKAHDDRARSETKEYAKPEMAFPPIKKAVAAPKSVAMVASTSATASEAGSDKSKAKPKPKSDTSRPIVIDDDEDLVPKPVAGGSRKRTSSSEGQRSSKQARVDPQNVIELD